MGDSVFDRLLTRYFAPSDIQLGVHWYHFGHTIMPPFIEERLDVQPDNKHVLVYLPFEDLHEIKSLLTPFNDKLFLCFHPDLKDDRNEGHILWRKTSKPKFQMALKNCSGVIANGGFELSSECLQLGKKLLIKPLKGQYEQSSNMLTLQTLGLCTSMLDLDDDIVEEWLDASAPEPLDFPQDPSIFIDWLKQGNWHSTRDLCEALWQQVTFPASVELKLQTLASAR